jgi:hypothetical protein
VALVNVGEVGRASEPLGAAVETAELLGHGIARINAVTSLAWLRLAEGNAGEALRLAGEAKSAAKERGHRGVELQAIRILAQSFMALDPREVERPSYLLAEAIDLAESIDAFPAMLGCLQIYVNLLAKSGQMEEARRQCGRAIVAAEKAGMTGHESRFRSIKDTLAEAPELPRRGERQVSAAGSCDPG